MQPPLRPKRAFAPEDPQIFKKQRPTALEMAYSAAAKVVYYYSALDTRDDEPFHVVFFFSKLRPESE